MTFRSFQHYEACVILCVCVKEHHIGYFSNFATHFIMPTVKAAKLYIFFAYSVILFSECSSCYTGCDNTSKTAGLLQYQCKNLNIPSYWVLPNTQLILCQDNGLSLLTL